MKNKKHDCVFPWFFAQIKYLCVFKQVSIMSKRIVILLVAALATVTACNKASGGLSPDGYANQGTKVADKNSALSPYEQKQKLEAAGKELVEEIDVDNWKATAEFMRALGEHFEELGDDSPYAFDAFEDWSQEVEEAILTSKAKNGKMTMRYTYALSKLPKGTFKEEDGEFEFTEGGSNVKIITYVDGKTVTITITNGAESKEYEIIRWDYEGSELDWEMRHYEGGEYSEWHEIYSVKIPAWINIEVKEGAARRLNWKANFSYTDADGNGKIELEKDKADVSTEIKFDNYTLAASEKYSSDKGVGHASASASVYHGSKKLLAAGAESDVEINGGIEDNFSGSAPNTVKAAVDVLGQVQAKGTIDFERAKYVEQKIDRYADEEQYARSLKDLESCVDIAIYYDRKAGRQAWLGFEPLYDEWYHEWSYTPVIRFADDSSYGIDEFFNANDFSSLIDALNDWAQEVAEYFGTFK